MSNSLLTEDDGQTSLTPEELLELKPSLTTRSQLNEVERMNINEARGWALRPANLKRDDLTTDHFARELHRRMFNQVWHISGRLAP